MKKRGKKSIKGIRWLVKQSQKTIFHLLAETPQQQGMDRNRYEWKEKVRLSPIYGYEQH